MALPTISLPTFIAIIPSTGKSEEYHPFTTDDEKSLLIAEEGGDVAEILLATKNLISKCFKNVDVDTLTSFDIDYLFIQLISKSVSNVSDLYYKCQCETTNKLSIDLGEIEVQQFDEDADAYIKYTPVDYKLGGVKIPITKSVGVIMKHFGFKEQTEYSLIKNPTEADLVKLSILSVYDEESVTTKDDFETKKEWEDELNAFYGSIPPKELLELKKFIRNTPRVRHESSFKCRKCGHQEEIVHEDLESFFG